MLARCVGIDQATATMYLVLGDDVTEEEVLREPLFKTCNVEFVCGICEGEGVVACDEFDPDSGRYMRGVGSQKCICQLED